MNRATQRSASAPTRQAGEKLAKVQLVCRGRSRAFLAALSLLLSGSTCGQPTNEFDLTEPQPWLLSATARAGAGYRDNVLLSAARPQSSAFGLADLEFFAYRLPIDGTEVTFFASGEHKQFTDVCETDKQQLLIASASIKRRLGNVGTAALSVQYFYMDQVFDASTTEFGVGVVVARGHSLSGKPRLDIDLGSRTRLEFEGIVGHQWFESPLDDYLETGPRIGLSHEFRDRSQIGLSYQLIHRDYATRTQVSTEGIPLAGTELTYEMHRAELAQRQNWNKRRTFRTTAKLGIEAVHDNGSGYFDYQRYFGDASVRYEPGSWAAKAQVNLSYYEYPIQTATVGDSVRRHKTLLTFTFAATKRLTKRINLFAEYEYEESAANTAFDEYDVNTVSAGLQAEF
ncbi:MAG: hypothetical protein QHJ82_12385 [Verrucomicrobiota bacterium]|nr:hypothetical protein [Verrucomicrobiota bacterium]